MKSIYDKEVDDAVERLKVEKVNMITLGIGAFFITIVSVFIVFYVFAMSFAIAIVPLHYLWRFVRWITGL